MMLAATLSIIMRDLLHHTRIADYFIDANVLYPNPNTSYCVNACGQCSAIYHRLFPGYVSSVVSHCSTYSSRLQLIPEILTIFCSFVAQFSSLKITIIWLLSCYL